MRCREAVVLDASGRLPAKPFLIIGGRLADYAYYDMDKTVMQALRKAQMCV